MGLIGFGILVKVGQSKCGLMEKHAIGVKNSSRVNIVKCTMLLCAVVAHMIG